MQNLNSASGSHQKRLSQSLAVNNQSGENLADQINTTTEIVHVDFIGAEYMGNGLGGFDKKMPKGYNGGKATGKKGGNGGDGGDGNGGPPGNGKNGNGNGAGGDGGD